MQFPFYLFIFIKLLGNAIKGKVWTSVASCKGKSETFYQQKTYVPHRGKSPYIPPHLNKTYIPPWNKGGLVG